MSKTEKPHSNLTKPGARAVVDRFQHEAICSLVEEFQKLTPDPEEQLVQKYMEQVEAFAARDDISAEQLDAFFEQKLEEYKRESFAGFVHRVGTALASRRRKQDDNDQFVEDYVKVMTAGFGLPSEEQDQAFSKALHEVWDRRRREKAAKAKDEEGKK